MSIHTLVLALLVIISFLIALALLFLAFLFGKVISKNNPKNGIIFIKSGKELGKPIKAKIAEKCSKGVKYNYKSGFVIVPAKYEEVYYNHRRAIFINRLGQIIASPPTSEVTLDNAEKESLIIELMKSRIGHDAVSAMKGFKKTTGIILIAVIALIIGVVGAYGVIKFMDMQKHKQAQQQTQQTQDNLPSQNTPIEVQ